MNLRTHSVMFIWCILLISALMPFHASAADLEPIPYESFPHLIPEINDFTGAASQLVPIKVPPGRGGIEPSLKLDYNSYRHNGLLGKGWLLETGAIQRQTKWGVDYNQDDFVFISKGRRLDLVPIGNDRFQTRIETNFTRYIFHRASNYWEAISKDGTRAYFGNDTGADSKQTNSFGTFTWALDRVEDNNGNYMTVTYLRDQGQLYPLQIDYTGNTNSGDAPSNKVIFSYEGEPRPDVLTSYVSKSAFATALRLYSVSTYGNNQRALEYRLEYETSPVGQISLLKKIRILGSDGQTEIPSYTFTYQPGTAGRIVTGPQAEDIDMAYHSRKFADVTGDGKADLILIRSTSRTEIKVYPSNGNGTFGDGRPSIFMNVPGSEFDTGGGDSHYFADLNGDAIADYILHAKRSVVGDGPEEYLLNRFMVFLNNGDGTFVEAGSIDRDPGALMHTTIGFLDNNFDGLNDIIVEEGNHKLVYPSDGQGGFEPAYPCNLPEDMPGYFRPKGRYFADVNGDGLTDLINYYYDFEESLGDLRRRNFTTYLSNGNGGFEFAGDQFFEFFFPDNGSIYDTNRYGNIVSVQFKDVNNDNLADLILQVTNGDHGQEDELQIYLSDGHGQYSLYQRIDVSQLIPNIGGSLHHLADINGDGWLDLIRTVYEEVIGDSTSPEEIINYIDTFLTTDTAPYDLMEAALSPSDAVMNYRYRHSSDVDNHYFLPFLLYPVKETIIDDGIRNDPAINTYYHENGYYDAPDHEFRGFGLSTHTHPDGTYTKKHYYVGNADYTGYTEDCYYLAGLIRHVENFGFSILSRIDYTWEAVENAVAPWAFVKLTNKRTEYYDGKTVFTQTGYDYNNANGNVMFITHSGTGARDIVTEYDYVNYSGDDWNPIWRKSLEKTYYVGFSEQPARHLEYVHEAETGNLKQKIGVNHDQDVGDSVWQYDYYTNGNLHYEYDANNNPPTEYASYDITGIYPTLIRNPAGHEIKKGWDVRWGLEDWITDSNNQTTDFTYDEFGRLKQTDHPDGGQAIHTYHDYCSNDECSNVVLPRRTDIDVKTTDTAFAKDIYYLDGLGRIIQTVKTGEGTKYSVTKTHYDNMGRIDFHAGPFFQQSTAFLAWNSYSREGYTNNAGLAYPYAHTQFDLRSRPETITSRDGQNGLTETTFGYLGYAVTTHDPDKSAKTEEYDHLGRITEMIDHPDSGDIHTNYLYNAANDLLEVRNHFWTQSAPDKNRIRNIYDSLGRRIYMDDPDMGQWQYRFDYNGNMILQTDAKGNRIQFNYDELNRIELKDYLDTEEHSVTYQYDQAINGVGRLYSIDNRDVLAVYLAYDPMGRAKESTKTIIGAAPRTTLWNYDYNGKIIRLTYPHTDTSPPFHVDYGFHAGTNLVHTVTGSDGTVFTTITDYEPNTKIGRIDFDNGVHARFNYDRWSQRLNNLNTIAAGGAVAQNRKYTYSPAGDITRIDDQAREEIFTYTYDKMHRLKSETTSKGSLGVIPGILEMQYDDPDHIHAVSKVIHNGTSFAYRYDTNGNQESGPDLTDPQSVVTRSLTFNTDNKPVNVEHPSGGTISLVYDGWTQRVKKTGSGKETYYFSQEFELIDNVETFYIFAGNLRVAMVKNNTPLYFHKDHLGSSTAITDAGGNIIETAMYMPYGGKRGEDGISASQYKFTDQELDAETGLYNYDARLYDPIIGRFVSADPIVQAPYYSQSFDRFSYVFNNPLIYTDPTGYQSDDDSTDDESEENDSVQATVSVADVDEGKDCVNDKGEQVMDFANIHDCSCSTASPGKGAGNSTTSDGIDSNSGGASETGSTAGGGGEDYGWSLPSLESQAMASPEFSPFDVISFGKAGFALGKAGLSLGKAGLGAIMGPIGKKGLSPPISREVFKQNKQLEKHLNKSKTPTQKYKKSTINKQKKQTTVHDFPALAYIAGFTEGALGAGHNNPTTGPALSNAYDKGRNHGAIIGTAFSNLIGK